MLSGDREYHPTYVKAVKAYEFVLEPSFQDEYEKLLPENAKLVLSHGDVQECNFLVHHEDNRRMTLVDFDYVGFNYRGFDLGAYVNECQLDNNHKGDFPYVAYYKENEMTPEEEKTLVRIYLEREWEIKKARHEHALAELKKREEEKGEMGENNEMIDEVGEKEAYISGGQFDELMQELQLMKPLGHIYWGVWALATVPIERRDQPVFNYHFSLTRLDGYYKTKP